MAFRYKEQNMASIYFGTYLRRNEKKHGINWKVFIQSCATNSISPNNDPHIWSMYHIASVCNRLCHLCLCKYMLWFLCIDEIAWWCIYQKVSLSLNNACLYTTVLIRRGTTQNKQKQKHVTRTFGIKKYIWWVKKVNKSSEYVPN